ncbi:SRPBCC family protein [Phenylobacterium sp.]|uniref:SRPBCC family protein n=1 Tax=Phenylobacterium sp. TaxID=1871053 RepID=UPI0027227740|nr:SRPBCC family protein [Phenylobacterium sp.]MDO8324687.1 SRPBCC family protein [Phenylobacterium sp.]MDP3634691.1 SRPBCC family protein [Phenylobacterium sp.]
MTRHRQASVQVAATPERLFAHLDDQTRLAAHMARPSMMMGGGRMSYDFDERRGQAVGSHIRMGGRAFGLELFVDEVVTERIPPRRKVWRTVGRPRLIIIGDYEMGFEATPVPDGAALRVWIDYELAPAGLGRLVPALADAYARWCVERMAGDARRTFGAVAPVRAGRPSA